MRLATRGHPLFEVVIARGADEAVRYAAEELQRYVDRMGQGFPGIRTDDAPVSPRAILVGASRHSRKLFPGDPAKGLTRDGYVLQTSGEHLLIQGATPRGTLYGVYDILERFGIRWWTPHDETVPLPDVLELPDLDHRVEPPLAYRGLWYRNAMDADWQARMRLNGGTMAPIHMQARHGGAEIYAGHATGHTYARLVPTETYFDAHPEYFGEVKGVRLRHANQLCCTHPDVADIAAATLRRWLAETPGARMASVTQNDHGNWCTCRECAALIARHGSPAAPALHLANEVARRLEKDHPDVLIDVFAYAYTEKPPAGMTAHRNVLVRLAPIGNCFGHAIRTCPRNQGCRDALDGWAGIAKHLFVWHYVTDFFHYMTPFPNLPCLQDDLNTYLAHGLKGLFLQGDGNSWGGDMCELKAYLMARLAWDPTLNARSVRSEFLAGYYRSAAPAVEEYVAVFEQAFARAGRAHHLHLYRTLWENDAAYLTRPVLDKARRTLTRARRDAADDPQVLERLDRAEAGLNYTDLFYYERPAPREPRGRAIVCPVSPRRARLMTQLFDASARIPISHYGEQYGRYTTISSLRRAWQDGAGTHALLSLRAGGARLRVCPDLGGRIVEYGPASGRTNLLGAGSPRTFGYPCAGGYEEYACRAHQSPGFSERYSVAHRSHSGLALQARLEIGLAIERRIRLDPADGSVVVDARLLNPGDAELPGCLRCHLEIDLDSPPEAVEFWARTGGVWTRQEGKPQGAWYDEAILGGWAFWSPAARRGVWQTWTRVGALFLGSIPGEPGVLALDLAFGRDNAPIPAGGAQRIVHRFGCLNARPELALSPRPRARTASERATGIARRRGALAESARNG